MSNRIYSAECNLTEVYSSLNQIPEYHVSFPPVSFSLVLRDFMSMKLTESYQIKNYEMNACVFQITIAMCYCCKQKKFEPYFVDNREQTVLLDDRVFKHLGN